MERTSFRHNFYRHGATTGVLQVIFPSLAEVALVAQKVNQEHHERCDSSSPYTGHYDIERGKQTLGESCRNSGPARVRKSARIFDTVRHE